MRMHASKLYMMNRHSSSNAHIIDQTVDGDGVTDEGGGVKQLDIVSQTLLNILGHQPFDLLGFLLGCLTQIICKHLHGADCNVL